PTLESSTVPTSNTTNTTTETTPQGSDTTAPVIE
ncbi:MAG: hypothetical protein RI911_295, partial [Candidatus Parcubacteria bacterium]